MPALALVADFNWLDVCWKLNTADKRQSRRSWSVWNFLSQLAREHARVEILLNLLFVKREGTGEKCGGQNVHLGHSDSIFNSW